MLKYLQRWNAAKSFAETINSKLKDGDELVVEKGDDDRWPGPIVIKEDLNDYTKNEIYLVSENKNTKQRYTQTLFEADPKWDHGVHDTIADTKARFAKIHAYRSLDLGLKL